MADLSKPAPERPGLAAKIAEVRGYKMTWQELLAQKRSFIRGETGTTDEQLREQMPEMFADIMLGERDATIAALRAELAEERAASEGALMIIATERAEVAALRAEVERLRKRVAMPDHELAYECELLWGGVLAANAKNERLTAGITAAVEGRYLGDAWHPKAPDALLAHLRALLDPQAPDAGEGR